MPTDNDNDRPRSIRLTETELREVIAEAVSETFVKLGIDATNPLEMQKDFQHLREWRQTTNAVKRKGMLTLAAIIVAGLAGLVWMSVSHKP